MLLLHQCRNEMVAGVGIAPTSAGLQPAAHLSEPSSVRVEREYGEACSPYVSRDVAEPGENGEWSDDTLALHLKVVPRRGDAPRSASYQPAALLTELTDLDGKRMRTSAFLNWMQGPELHRRGMLMRHAGALALPAI